ncbi:MAG: nucleotide-binding protein [Chloroflexota bacterium]
MSPSKRPPATRDPEPGRLTTTRSSLASELSDRIERGNELLGRVLNSAEALKATRADYYTWDEYNSQLLRRRFTTDEVESAYRDHAFISGGRQSFAEEVSELHEDVRRKLRRLRSVQEQLPLYDEPARVDEKRADETVASRSTSAPQGDSIFVVHGHDEVRKLEVTRFLTQVTDHAPTVLHEQSNEGRTIVEKLEHFGRQSVFAVVLLTADDEGRERHSEGVLLPRGRQNVVMELGFFIAALGRSHVVLLYENEVELPSDMAGVLYVRLDDAGGWKLALARELSSAGIPTDLNSAT